MHYNENKRCFNFVATPNTHKNTTISAFFLRRVSAIRNKTRKPNFFRTEEIISRATDVRRSSREREHEIWPGLKDKTGHAEKSRLKSWKFKLIKKKSALFASGHMQFLWSGEPTLSKLKKKFCLQTTSLRQICWAREPTSGRCRCCRRCRCKWWQRRTRETSFTTMI